MTGEGFGFTIITVAAALASLVVIALRRRKNAADLAFAVFCGSVAVVMLRPLVPEPPVWMALALAVGGSATCNAYWLVSRALFRGDAGVDRGTLAVAGGIAVLIVVHAALPALSGPSSLRTAVGALLTLASSAVLVLAWIEPLRGWTATGSIGEKRLRIAHFAIFGACMAGTATVDTLARADATWQTANEITVTASALAILVHTHIALAWRQRHTEGHEVLVPTSVQASAGVPQASPTPDDLRLGTQVQRALESAGLYRQPELKVADLAAHLRQPEHRVTRAITQGLGERNFNQLVNRYRIAEACRALREHPDRTILEISLDCGFASLGPFNRAFKARVGCTPSAWRANSGAICPPTPESFPQEPA